MLHGTPANCRLLLRNHTSVLLSQFHRKHPFVSASTCRSKSVLFLVSNQQSRRIENHTKNQSHVLEMWLSHNSAIHKITNLFSQSRGHSGQPVRKEVLFSFMQATVMFSTHLKMYFFKWISYIFQGVGVPLCPPWRRYWAQLTTYPSAILPHRSLSAADQSPPAGRSWSCRQEVRPLLEPCQAGTSSNSRTQRGQSAVCEATVDRHRCSQTQLASRMWRGPLGFGWRLCRKRWESPSVSPPSRWSIAAIWKKIGKIRSRISLSLCESGWRLGLSSVSDILSPVHGECSEWWKPISFVYSHLEDPCRIFRIRYNCSTKYEINEISCKERKKFLIQSLNNSILVVA